MTPLTPFQFNMLIVALIAVVTAASYMLTNTAPPPAPPLVQTLMQLSPTQLDALDRELATMQAELKATSAEMDAWLKANR